MEEKEKNQNVTESQTLDELCQELMPLTVDAEQSAHMSGQLMEVTDSTDTAERALTGPNLPSSSSSQTTKTAAQRKAQSGAAKLRYKALKAQGVEPSQAAALSTKSFAELKKMGYRFEQSKSERPVKRPRVEEESPQGQPIKKAQRTTESVPTSRPSVPYSTALTSTRVGVKDSNPMSDTQLDRLYDAIVSRIASSEKGKGPAFTGLSLKPGWLLITCADQHAVTWLGQNVPSLKPWPGADLSLISERDLPKTKVGVVFIPNPEAKDTNKVLSLLRAQNEGLNTEIWKVLHKKDEKGGVILTLSMDDLSVEILKRKDLKANLAFKTVQFRIKGAKASTQNEGTSAPPPPEPQPSTSSSEVATDPGTGISGSRWDGSVRFPPGRGATRGGPNPRGGNQRRQSGRGKKADRGRKRAQSK